MNVTFLGQGFEEESRNAVGNYLVQHLRSNNFHSFFGISAFASEAGIRGLSEYILAAKDNFDSINVVVGIDQEGTSREALLEILNLDINGYIFYQRESPIFHPKIYLFEGNDQTVLIIGSSNLTARGLFGNVESSLLIEFPARDEDGENLLRQLKDYYRTLFDFSDPNLFRITQENIENFIAKGIVPNERRRNRKHSKKATERNEYNGPGNADMVIPRRRTARIPTDFIQNRPRTNPIVASIVEELELPEAQNPLEGSLVWSKESLSRSDAQNVAEGSNPTGNLKFAQANFRVDGVLINHSIYFRDQVFNNLNWVKTKATSDTYEEAFCDFHFILLGNDLGIQTIKLSHDSVRIAGQGNVPTWLHWGHTLIALLQETNITGRRLNLYRAVDEASFAIEVV